jgi:hypothetical protein
MTLEQAAPAAIDFDEGRAGRGARSAHELPTMIALRIFVDRNIRQDFLRLGNVHVRGRVGVLGDALDEFMAAYDKRQLPPPPERLPRAVHDSYVDADIPMRFEDFVGQPMYRNGYVTLAVTEHVKRRRCERR